MINFITIIDATTPRESFGTFTKRRSIAASPVLGKYIFADFPLSSVKNSHCHTVLIFTKFSSRALYSHIKSGKQWNLMRNIGGVYFLNSKVGVSYEPYISYERLEDHIDALSKNTSEYVFITHAYGIYSFKFSDKVQEHVKSGADISYLTKDGQLINMFVVKRELLIQLILNHKASNESDLVETVQNNEDTNKYVLNEIKIEENYHQIQDYQTYYDFHMDYLKNYKAQGSSYHDLSSITTREQGLPPVFVKNSGSLKQSMAGLGSQIDGEINNSVLWYAVKVGKHSQVNNSLIFSKTQIGENCIIENCIIDKEVVIGDNVILKGTPEKIRYIDKGRVIVNETK